MTKLNIIEALAITRAAPLLVDLEIYENVEEAVEYGLEAYKEFLEVGGYEPGDEVLETILEIVTAISTDGKPLHKYPAASWFPGTDTRVAGEVKVDYSPRRGELIREEVWGMYLYKVPSNQDQSWYLSPWTVPEIPGVTEDSYRSFKVSSEGDRWSAIREFGDGPDVFIAMYQEIGWHVYRIPCATTGYWDLLAYPEPLECVKGRIRPA